MQQVRIFEVLETNLQELEDEINTWLRETKVKIISITGNVAPQSQISQPKARPAPSDVLLVVLYEVNESEAAG